MTSLLGADVSHWQSATPTAGLSFLFVKATEGTGYADPMYATHVGRAISHGLLPGAYHFARRSADIDRQARWFVQHATGARTLAVDVENLYDAHGNLIDPKMTRTQVRALIAAVKLHDSLRRPVGLYMSESGFYTDVAADFRWVAQWDRTPVIVWDIHQYRGNPLDLDLARDLPTLNRVFRVQPVAAPHYAATVTTPTNLYNAEKRRWVYNGRNAVKVGTKLVIRGAQYVKGGVRCYPIVGPLYAGYWVPVANVKLGAKVP